MKFHQVFSIQLPILGMLHLKGENADDILQRAKHEADVMADAGVDAVIVEDYFGSAEDAERVLDWLQQERSERIYGVNILDNFELSYELALRYGAKFMQVDSVAGHLLPQDDKDYGRIIARYRADKKVMVLGGVRFKYQPYLSGRSLEEDLEIGKARCDAIVVTGEGTGMVTEMEKVWEFRGMLGGFPLIVGAGMTAQNAATQLAIADGAIVGSTFKVDGIDKQEIDAGRVRDFMNEVTAIRSRG